MENANAVGFSPDDGTLVLVFLPALLKSLVTLSWLFRRPNLDMQHANGMSARRALSAYCNLSRVNVGYEGTTS